MRYLCVDVGSSYMKTAVADTEQNMLKLYPEQKVTSFAVEQTGLRYEVNSQALYGQFKQNIDYILNIQKEKIDGILISTQMHGFIFSDKNGKALTPYISWQDSRSLLPIMDNCTYLDYLKDKLDPKIMENAGVHIKPGLGMCNAYTLLQEKHYKIPDGATFCTLGAYLTGHLTGEYACHLTNAAPTGLADIAKKDWNTELIEELGFSRFDFPKILPEFCIVGEYRGIPVYPDLGDQQCSVLGGLLREEIDINVNIGTAAQVSRITNSIEPGVYETRPFLDGKYLPTITSLPGGRNLKVMMSFFKDTVKNITGQDISEELVWNAMEKNAKKIELGGISVSAGFFHDVAGNLEGSIRGILKSNFSFARVNSALYLGIADIFYNYIMLLAGNICSIKKLVFTGGVSKKSPQLKKLIVERLGIEAAESTYPCEVFVGLYHLALILSNTVSGLDTARMWIEEHKITIEQNN